jgi:hypothetical protein
VRLAAIGELGQALATVKKRKKPAKAAGKA